MKLPLSWLTSYVDLDLSIDELVTVMSARGLEVEGVTHPGTGTGGVRTARVLAWEAHPDADRLRVVRVTGEDGEVELVCGAANFEVGDVVAHAVPGGSIPGMTMEARRIRGVVSNGMLASPRELELGDDHAGILVLPADTPLGAQLTELLPLAEPVLEVAVQPDRGDHLSVLGVARDLAAILDTSWHTPAVSEPLTAPSVPVTLATDACERFATWTLEDVAIAGSPPWLRQRLAQCGVRSIDTVVDVTNYVMLELGQPLHAFDLDRLHGPSLTVRRAEPDEQLTTLDGQQRSLVAGDLVIDDDRGPVSLAGVMGGADTEVHAGTTRVLLEAAVWEPSSIRATSRRLGLVSEASQRFERGVDPEGAGRAAARAADLLVELAGARPSGSDVERSDPPPSWAVRETVTVDVDRVARLVAADGLDAARQRALLSRSGCELETEGSTLRVTPPSWRGDLAREADVGEEVARLHGYERIPARLPAVGIAGGSTPAQRLERAAREAALAGGFHEVLTRPFVGETALLGVAPSDGRVRLANPLAQDAAAMRPSLLEGLLSAVRRNVGQGRPGTAVAELGRLFRPADDPLAAILDAAAGSDWRWRDPDGADLPVQPRALGLVAQGLRHGPGWLDPAHPWELDDLLAVLDEVVARLAPHAGGLERRSVTRPGLHPGRTATLHRDGHEIGVVGQLHPDEAESRDLPEPVLVAELLLEPLLVDVPADGHPPSVAPELVRHPAMSVDVAVLADEARTYAEVERAVRAGAGELLDELWWFDEYRGEQVGPGRRSVAIRLRLQAADRQLTDADAEGVIAAVATEVERIGASLRR